MCVSTWAYSAVCSSSQPHVAIGGLNRQMSNVRQSDNEAFKQLQRRSARYLPVSQAAYALSSLSVWQMVLESIEEKGMEA